MATDVKDGEVKTEELTPEQIEAKRLSDEGQSAYQRAKVLSMHSYGKDPDKEVVRLPDGTDEQGKVKFKEWDFRKPEVAEEPPVEETAEQKAEREAKEAADKAAKELAAKETAKPKAKKKAAQAPPPQVDTEALVEQASERAAQKVVEATKPKAEEATNGLELSDEEQYTLAVFEAMEKANPKNAGLKDRTIKFWQKEQDRIKRHEEGHPGEVYDPDSPDNKAFYEGEPQFDEREFNRVAIKKEASEEASRLVAAERSKNQDELEGVKTQVKMRDEAPELTAREMSGKAAMIAAVLPEMAKAIAGEGAFELTPETVKKLEEGASPLEFRVIDEVADELGLQLVELERLSRYSRAYKPNLNWEVELKVSGQKFRPHKELLGFADWLEQALANDPKSERGGKKFLTNDQWAERVQKGEKDLPKRFYTLTPEDVRVALIEEYSNRATRKIEEARKWAELAGKKNGKAQAPASAKVETTEVAPPEEKPPKPKPPSSASASDLVNTNTPKPPTEAEKLAQMQSVY